MSPHALRLLFLFVLCVSALTSQRTESDLPARAVAKANIAATTSWLRSTASRSSGAFTFTPTVINPRYGNIAALGLLLDPSSATRVQQWMKWYLGHLNWPDQWGVYGTIYDHYISDKNRAVSSGSSLSVASNGATFLSLAWALWQRGDARARKFLVTASGQSPGHIFDVIGAAVVHVAIDAAHLVRYDSEPMYLSSASDVYRGLSDLSLLLSEAFNISDRAAYYRSKAQRVAHLISTDLWDEQRGLYRPYIGAQGVNMKVWHPDAVSQVYPIVYGLISPSSPRALDLWRSLNNAWPRWTNASYASQDPTPWEVVTFAAVLMGDVEAVRARLANTQSDYVARNFPFPWTCEEAGWFLHTNTYMSLRVSALPFA